MQVSAFDFELPPRLIAQSPAEPRDSARLLQVTPQHCHDRTVRDLPSLLNPGDVLVFNDSRVIPARLYSEISGRQVEILLHQPQRDDAAQWLAFARPARKLTSGMVLNFAPDFTATVSGRTADGQVLLRFHVSGDALFAKLHAHGHVPLPPYIARADDAADVARYQTVYARHDGSVAAPTAGLHFTPALLGALEARGIHRAFVTLHVGAGTFQPVKVEDTREHVMHRESIAIGQEACDAINRARAGGGKVVAVGTTSLRILESVADEDGQLAPFTGETGIFITPGTRFKIVDRLLTNFHLPKSTLFMLVCAFSGLTRMQQAYAHAMARNYRFYSYGDACLLDRHDER